MGAVQRVSFVSVGEQFSVVLGVGSCVMVGVGDVERAVVVEVNVEESMHPLSLVADGGYKGGTGRNYEDIAREVAVGRRVEPIVCDGECLAANAHVGDEAVGTRVLLVF